MVWRGNVVPVVLRDNVVPVVLRDNVVPVVLRDNVVPVGSWGNVVPVVLRSNVVPVALWEGLSTRGTKARVYQKGSGYQQLCRGEYPWELSCYDNFAGINKQLFDVYTGMGVLPPAAALRDLPAFSSPAAPVPFTPLSTALSVPSLTIPAPTRATGMDTGLPASLLGISLSTKIVAKILALEFVDMAEMVQGNWSTQDDDEQKCCHRRPQRKGPVTDILVWVECFSSMVTVLSTNHPDKTPQFMAYQRTIVKAHRSFAGDGWLIYDTCFRRKAALTKLLEWGQVDFSLYNETFTGRARPVRRCTSCGSEHHLEMECPESPQSQAAPDSRRVKPRQTASTHLCQLFNAKYGNKCHYSPCRFSHRCTECRGNHPVAQCSRSGPPAKMSRPSSPRFRGRK